MLVLLEAKTQLSLSCVRTVWALAFVHYVCGGEAESTSKALLVYVAFVIARVHVRVIYLP